VAVDRGKLPVLRVRYSGDDDGEVGIETIDGVAETVTPESPINGKMTESDIVFIAHRTG